MQYEKQLEKLNSYQKEAVLDESNACLVNANVGSGKTTVLISKIIYLHYARQIPYRDMVVLTFTNKAADEIRERLLRLDETVSEEELQWFGTFHGVCLNLLKKVLPIEKLGYTKDFMVMPPEEEVEMAEQLILEHKLKIKYKNRLKKRLEQAMAIEEEEKKISRYQDEIFVLTDLLRMGKRAQDKMTYQDLLDNTCTLLKLDKEHVGENKRNNNGDNTLSYAEEGDSGIFHPKWLIIDEVQDSDGKQLELLDYMKYADTSLFAVGDPNQVIYSWRGSALNVFYTLRSKYGARELTLPINYRSSGSILEAARFFLQNGSKLEGVRDFGNKIVIKNHYNQFQEADYLAMRLKELHEQGIPYKEMAIFYRLQNQSKTFEDVLEREGIPFEVSLKKTLQEIPVLNWLIRVLRFSVHPSDKASEVMVTTNRDYSGIPVEKMTNFIEACGKGLQVEDLYEYFELHKCLRPTASSYAEDKEAVDKFLGVLEKYIQNSGLDFVDGLKEFLNHSTLYGINIFEQEIHKDRDSVKLMTLHASKGLEFSRVFITGVNYGLIPLHSKSMDEEDEERRLFFVGMTRAKDYLEMSYYTSPEQFRATPGPSRYLSMIPANLVADETLQGKPVMDTAERLQEIKRQILESRSEMKYLFPEQEKGDRKQEKRARGQENESEKESSSCKQKKVVHPKYGNGAVVREDENNIVVEFEDYGEKEFLKAFSELEFMEK